MEIELKKIFERDPERTIENMENKLGIEFPEDYRNFIYKHNGGMPAPKKFFIGAAQESILSVFYGITNRETLDIEEVFLLFDNNYENKYIPVGEDPGGNQICLCITGENFGKVYFRDHEVAPPKNLYLIANNFTEFLEKLH